MNGCKDKNPHTLVQVKSNFCLCPKEYKFHEKLNHMLQENIK